MTESGGGGRGRDRGSSVAGRRTMGPVQRPGRGYSMLVGFGALVLIVFAVVHMIVNRDEGILGLQQVGTDKPLSEFAVPVATSQLEGDANIAQDDCESDQLPCPVDQRRTPACRVAGRDVIRVCDYFDRPLVISFWFTRGGSSCETQQDVVSQVYRRYRGRVGFLSIDVRDSRDSVRDMVRERHWRMPVGYDHDGAVATLYRVGGCPTFVYAYPGGILQSASIGELNAGQLSARVRRLLAATARRQGAA